MRAALIVHLVALARGRPRGQTEPKHPNQKMKFVKRTKF